MKKALHMGATDAARDTMMLRNEGIRLNSLKTRKQRINRITSAPGRAGTKIDTSDTVTTSTSKKFQASLTKAVQRLANRFTSNSSAKTAVKPKSIAPNRAVLSSVAGTCASARLTRKLLKIIAATTTWTTSPA